MNNLFSDSVLTVNISNIISNYKSLCKKAKGAKVAAVVKANAYGLGVEQVSRALHHQGCRQFFVATLDEALQLRAALPESEIAVFHGIREGQEDYFKSHKITPVLNSLEQVKIWRKTNILNPILHVDTGMSRLGVSIEEAEELAKKKLPVKMVMSHLACADENKHEQNAVQLERAKHIKSLFADKPFSLANSYGIYLSSDYHFDITRPGAAIYGINPTPGKKNPMKPVATLTSRILQIRNIDKDCNIGYGATREIEAGRVIAVIPVGYADGYLSYLANKGKCAIDGQLFDVVGRVSMDMITVDVTDYKGSALKAGDEVQILGCDINADDIASSAGTIGYEILTSLGNRYKRVYVK